MNKVNSFIGKLGASLSTFLVAGTACAALPLWTFSVAPGSNPTQTLIGTKTTLVSYLVTNQSTRPKTLHILPTPGVTQQSTCYLTPRGSLDSTCRVTLLIEGAKVPAGGLHGGPRLCQVGSNGLPNPNQCYQPSPGQILNITKLMASLVASPPALVFTPNDTGTVTITNPSTSQSPVRNLRAIIPTGSPIFLFGTTCGTSLPVGGSCTFTFGSPRQTAATNVLIQGSNASLNYSVTVDPDPQLAIIGPAQQNRVIGVNPARPLSLQIQNIHSGATALNVTVVPDAKCPLVTGTTNCSTIAPQGTCTILVTSPVPYAPCTITVRGTNTENNPSTRVAFRTTNASGLTGLVYAQSGGISSIVEEVERFGIYAYTIAKTGATSFVDGATNTSLIIASGVDNCSLQFNCSALVCRTNHNADLPAINQWLAIQTALCPSVATTGTCDFGNFLPSDYWSSTEAISTAPDNTAPNAFGIIPHMINSAASIPKTYLAGVPPVRYPRVANFRCIG